MWCYAYRMLEIAGGILLVLFGFFALQLMAEGFMVLFRLVQDLYYQQRRRSFQKRSDRLSQ